LKSRTAPAEKKLKRRRRVANCGRWGNQDITIIFGKKNSGWRNKKKKEKELRQAFEGAVAGFFFGKWVGRGSGKGLMWVWRNRLVFEKKPSLAKVLGSGKKCGSKAVKASNKVGKHQQKSGL